MSSATPKLVVAEDRTVYPIEDDMGEGSLQRFISELLRVLVERWLESKGKPTFVGADQFFYLEQYNPIERVAPDVYVVPGVAPGKAIDVWKVWETACVPSFALYVVLQDVDRYYLSLPKKYDRLGVAELVVFDPDYATSPTTRARFQVFRKSKRGLVCVEATSADRVKSKVLGCHLRAIGVGDDSRVRLGTGFNGETLVPTDVEAKQQSEAAAREERAMREQAEAGQHQAEATSRDLAAQLAQVKAELALLRGTPKPSSPKSRPSRRK